MKTNITIKNAVKRFGDNTVIPNLSIEIPEGEFFTLLGASGCGKTTLLRMMAGFNTIEGGDFYFGEKRINDIPSYKRNIGMVFQNYAIFPHMNTYDNVAYGLKNRKLSKHQIDERVKEVLELVQISDLIDRMPQKMSGGQQQRVALARAIVIKPDVLLMDEPLSNLDAKLRLEMRHVIKDIQNQFKITTVYVTHDQEEALAISDRIAVMKLGEIQQVDTPERIYLNPKNLYVGTFIGRSNTIKAKLIEENIIEFYGGYKHKLDVGINEGYIGKDVMFMIRPHEFDISKDDGIKGKVLSRTFLGEVVQFVVELGDGTKIEVDSHINKSFSIEEDDDIYLQLILGTTNIFDVETEESLSIGGE